jgi:cbb3-type cytochrome oxidase subunit 1
MELGARFWFGIVGLAVGIAAAAYLIFALIGYAWYAWGLFGMLLFFSVILIIFAYVWDRRDAARRRRTAA